MNPEEKIVIASSKYIVASGIGAFFSDLGYKVIKIFNSQDALERLLISESPNFVFIDDSNDEFKVEKTIAFLSFTQPAKTVLIANKIDKERIDLLSKVGVKKFISTNVSEKELKELQLEISTNDLFFDKEIKAQYEFSPEDAFKNTCAELNISEREVEIIKLIAEGFINKEIADKLFLSTHTVNTHRKNIMAKLGVSNATGIVIFAVKEKLISPKDFLFSSKH